MAAPTSAGSSIGVARRWELVLLAGLALAVPLGYSLYTQHVWEDFFITFRHSENLCAGKGLLYNEGERVHGFTSPLGVLLPAACHVAAGQPSYLPGLWLYRALSILAFAGGGLLLIQSLPGEARLGRIAVGLLYVIEAKAVAFSTNGMETGFLLLFLAWGLYLLVHGGPARWRAMGLCWAGLMWTRPDGFVHVAALALAGWTFSPGSRRATLAGFLRSAAVGAALYLPWLIGAWSYYGSPIPHTMLAKSGLELGPVRYLQQAAADLPRRFLLAAGQVFQPIYCNSHDPSWPPGLLVWTQGLGLCCALYWLLPTRDRVGRMASLGFGLLCLYFAAMPVAAPWYLPPATMLGLVVLGSGLTTLAEAVRFPLLGKTLLLVLALLLLERVCLFGLTVRQMRIQQAEIEMGNRARIGSWLREHVAPGDTVYLEPLGYVGYFSGARMIDWPGLVSPEVVRLRKEKQLGFAALVPALRPDWLVLRPWEVDSLAEESFFREQYTLAATFDATERLQRHGWIPGEAYLLGDAWFGIYRRSR